MEIKKTRRSFLKSAVAAASTTAVMFPITKSDYSLKASFSGSTELFNIIPTPKYAHIDKANMIELPTDQPVILGRSVGYRENRWAVIPLIDTLKIRSLERSNVKRVLEHSTKLPPVCILAGAPEDHVELSEIFNRLKRKLPESSIGYEGYLLSAGPGGVRIVANTDSGVFYGAQTLLQLVREDKMVPTAEVADIPVMAFRGVHAVFRNLEDIPLLEWYIKEELPRCKANTFILQIDYNFKFKSHPEIYEEPMFTASQARSLARLCSLNNIRLIPLLQCFTHQGRHDRGGYNAFLRAYPHFTEQLGKEVVSYYSWCTSDPRIIPIACDLIDEYIDAFELDEIHLGMDECLDLSVCYFCRKKTPAEQFAQIVNGIYDHVTRKRNVRIMIWADRLINGSKTPFDIWESSFNGTHPAIHMIPKDVFLFPWHYYLNKSYPSVEQLEEAGLDYAVCGWREKEAIEALIAYATEHGGRHFQGYLATNWGGFIPMMRYMKDGTIDIENADRVKNQIIVNRFGMELAWAGVKK